jgi:hypothetical protein
MDFAYRYKNMDEADIAVLWHAVSACSLQYVRGEFDAYAMFVLSSRDSLDRLMVRHADTHIHTQYIWPDGTPFRRTLFCMYARRAVIAHATCKETCLCVSVWIC